MTSKILNKVFSHSKKTKTLIGVRKYGEGDNLFVGYIVDYNDTFIVLQHVTEFGVEDGLLIEKIDNIETFETADDYLKSFQFLFKNQNKVLKQTVKNIKLPESENWQYELLKNNFHKGKLVTIELNNDDIIINGYIMGFDEINLQFNPIDKLGKDEGITIYKLSDISGFTIDRLESRKRQAFYNWRKKS